MANVKAFLSHYLGEDALEVLAKGSELFKENTSTALDYDEIYKATQIVPKTVLSLLHRELHGLKENQHVDFPFKLEDGKEARVYVQKFSGDNYTGKIYQDGKVLARFQNRSLPGVGIILLSTFELYDFKEAAAPAKEPEAAPAPMQAKMDSEVNRLVDERMNLHSIVRKVVDQTLSEREAMDSLIAKKLNSMMKEEKKPVEEKKVVKLDKSETKSPVGYRLKEFLNSRKKESHKPKVFLMKNEGSIDCPDCGQTVFNGNKASGCICLGENKDSRVFIKKNQDGTVQVKFSSDWDVENISSLLETFRKRKAGDV